LTSLKSNVVIPFFLRYTWVVRLDLFLKTSRLVKRRAVAQELCISGRALVNGRTARPAKEVKPGDDITLLFSTRRIEIEILALPEVRRNSYVTEPYRVIRETRFTHEDEHEIETPPPHNNG
jgi:ribosomal 50S subunit-recycling heat shock protein